MTDDNVVRKLLLFKGKKVCGDVSNSEKKLKLQTPYLATFIQSVV